jgi:alkanesulfonate monooxygenase SsuD/methylene tetrahydromethanopterin reductase-like flavin-dependent oxidoreductase (luciferase family)
VKIEGAVVYQGAPRPVLGFVRPPGGAWKVRGDADGLPMHALPEHAASGLFSRALARERAQLYVYGTAGPPEVTAAGRALAGAMADWGPGVRVRFAARADQEVTAADLARYDLVLIGGVRTNRLVQRMMAQRMGMIDPLPIADGPDRLVAGALSLADADRGYRIAIPNPLARGRNVLIYGADTERALGRLAPFAKGNAAAWGPESNLDYIIWDGTGKVRLAGVFRERTKVGE